MLKYFLKFYFTDSQNYKKIIFKKRYVEFHFKDYDESVVFKCKKFKKKIYNYYEFPPLIKFDGKKRFSQQIKKYDLDCEKVLGTIADPIFDQNIKELKEYEKELGIQYGNFCYYEFLQ